MCTVTVLRPRTERWLARLACNRDEQWSRPAALPPCVRRFGARRAVLPIDPASDGTWVAVNDAGLALVLLNVNAGVASKSAGLRSRGTIIPALLKCDTLDAVVAETIGLDAGHHAPFRLVVVDCREIAELRSDDGQVRLVQRTASNGPFLFTSSGLGDHLVEEPRRQLFAELLGQGGDAEKQDLFHRHQWPERSHLSVCMRRPDARTVSHTLVVLTERAGFLTYHAAAPDEPGERRCVGIPLCREVRNE
jgi:uncharacterized protein with NRDE domain